MKKRIFLMMIMLLFFICIPMNVKGKEEGKTIDDINKNPKVQEFYKYIDKLDTEYEILNNFNIKDYIKNYMETGKGDFSIKNLSKGIGSFLMKEVKVTLKLMISLIVLAIISSLIKNLQDSFSNMNISNIAFYACYAVMIMLLTKTFLVSLELAKETIQGLADFMLVLLPVLVVLLTTAGGVAQAAIMDPVVIGAVVMIPRIYIDVLIPLILMGLVLVFVNNLSDEHKIDGICRMFKQVIYWIQGIILTVFIGILTIRGISSNTIDAVALKTAKFAIDNFVPIVGKAFSDALTTMAGYSLILKNAISTVGLIIIIVLVLFPIVKMVMMIFTYKMSAALIEPIGDKRIVNCINFAGDSLVLIMATMLSLSLMFFITIAIMANSGTFIVGG